MSASHICPPARLAPLMPAFLRGRTDSVPDSDWEDSEGMWTDGSDSDDSDWEAKAVAEHSAKRAKVDAEHSSASVREVIVVEDDSDSGDDTDASEPWETFPLEHPGQAIEDRLAEIDDLMQHATKMMQREEMMLQSVWASNNLLLPEGLSARRLMWEKGRLEYLTRKLVNDARMTHLSNMSKASAEVDNLNSSLLDITTKQFSGDRKNGHQLNAASCSALVRAALKSAGHINSAFFAIPRAKVFWSGKLQRLDVKFA